MQVVGHYTTSDIGDKGGASGGGAEDARRPSSDAVEGSRRADRLLFYGCGALLSACSAFAMVLRYDARKRLGPYRGGGGGGGRR